MSIRSSSIKTSLVALAVVLVAFATVMGVRRCNSVGNCLSPSTEAAAARNVPASGPLARKVLAGHARASTEPASPNEWLFVGDAFEGTFLQLWQEHWTWTHQRWRTEFSNLRRLGMKIVIVQWVQHDDANFCTADDGQVSTLDRIVAAADEARIDLYVGLSLRTSWWSADSFRPPYMLEELRRNEKLADKLYLRLRNHESFAGWYIPHEVTDIGVDGDRQGPVLKFFADLTGHLNSLDRFKPILAAGYTDRETATLVHFVTWWTLFLRESGVDVLVFQDGAGLSRKVPWQNVLPLVDALDSVAKELDGEIWLVGETFSQTHGLPLDEGGFQAVPADITRVRQQIVALGRFQKRLLAYSYFDYMRPSASAEAARLFESYRQFVDETSRSASRPASTRPTTGPISGM